MRRTALGLLTIGVAVGLASALAASPAAAQQYYRPIPDDYYRGPRMRLLAEGELGGVAGQEAGLGGGVTLGAGLQVNDIIAGFVQHRLLLADSLDMERGTFAHSYNSFMLDLTMFEMVQLGIGPSIDFGISGLCPVGDNAPATCTGVTDPYFGMDIRLAAMIYERSRARRRGLAIAAHVHPTWIDRHHVTTTFTLGVGFTLY